MIKYFFVIGVIIFIYSLTFGKYPFVKYSDSSRNDTVAYTCEQGLFVLKTKDKISGYVRFEPQTGSCCFVFKGVKKSNNQYQIVCSDFDDNQLITGNIIYNISGLLSLDGKTCKIKLDRNPDACFKAYGDSFIGNGLSFDVLSSLPNSYKTIGILKKDSFVYTNFNKKVKVYKNDIVKIIDIDTKFIKICYNDEDTNKEIIGKLKKNDILLIPQ